MTDGFIPISRRLFNNFLWKEQREFSRAEAWLDLLQLARFEANPVKEIIKGKVVEYGRGERPLSLRFLADRWQWSKNRVDKFLNLLISERMIMKRTANGTENGTVKGTAQTIIIICNYDSYNPVQEKTGQQKGQRSGQATGQSRDKYNKENKDIESNSIELQKKLDAAKAATLTRRENFYQSLIPFVGRYTPEMIREFYDYWSELTPSETKMRFEKQTTWEVGKRLATWVKNERILKNGKADRQSNREAKIKRLFDESTAISQGGQPFTATATLPEL